MKAYHDDAFSYVLEFAALDDLFIGTTYLPVLDLDSRNLTRRERWRIW